MDGLKTLILTPAQTLRAIQLFDYNVTPLNQVKAAYGPDADKDYLDSKVAQIARMGFLAWSAYLDPQSSERLMGAVIAKYGKDVSR